MTFRHWKRSWIAAAQPEDITGDGVAKAGAKRDGSGKFTRRIVACSVQHALAAADPGNHLFHTFWFLILRDGGAVAGSACFKGAADADGRVEIGYGLEKPLKNRVT